MNIQLIRYKESLSERWDNFIQRDSYNGTFLNSRQFLEYHPKDRFKDHSLMFTKGSTIVAVLPAADREDNHQRMLASHPGSTFGGLIFHQAFYDLRHIEEVLKLLEGYASEEGFGKLSLAQPSDIFSCGNNDLLEYFYVQRGFHQYAELASVINLNEYSADILSNFSASRRRGYHHAEKNLLVFREIVDSAGIAAVYGLLLETLEKHKKNPVHQLEELIDFYEKRLRGKVRFYGVSTQERLISASMVFMFDQKVFHTQYLVASQKSEDLQLFPNNFLIGNLIKRAKEEQFSYFSLGISTEEKGQVLNRSLAEFKQGFGGGYCLNKTFLKNVNESPEERIC